MHLPCGGIYTLCHKKGPHFVFTRESSYCFQCILAIAILSVCPSQGWISQKRCKLRSPNLHRWVPGRL